MGESRFERSRFMRETQRLDKLLSNFGFGTRKDIRQLVKYGVVKVDGRTATDSAMHVDPKNQIVEVNEKKLHYREFIFVMMHKPQGVVSATYDPRLRTVIDLLPEEFRCFDIFPVGRLDIDTEGLLVLTNDGQTAHELLSPKKHVPKTYYAQIEGRVTDQDGESFARGVELDDGYVTLPAALTILRSGEQSEIELTIHEGKFHQVKRMFEAVGKRVTYLKRIRMGGLVLDERLSLGQCREMTPEEIAALKGEPLEAEM